MATLYMMCGLSANGKTTFAKSFAKMNHIRYVNPDELYAVFNGAECNRSHKFEVWQALYQIVYCAEMDGADIIIDTNCLTLGQREEIRSRFPYFDNYQLMVIIASVENSKEWNSKRHRVVPQQELERQARIVDWPNLTDHYNGWNNIRYYYNDGSLFTKYREIYDGEDHDLRQKKEDNK